MESLSSNVDSSAAYHSRERAMSIFTFYPAQADGASLSFSAVSLPDDEAAMVWAEVVARQHPSCAEVVVWEGERLLGSVKVGPLASRPSPGAG